MRKWAKQDIDAWRGRYEAETHGMESAPSTTGPPVEAVPAETLSRQEHLQGLWVTLGLADETEEERRSGLVAIG